MPGPGEGPEKHIAVMPWLCLAVQSSATQHPVTMLGGFLGCHYEHQVYGINDTRRKLQSPTIAVISFGHKEALIGVYQLMAEHIIPYMARSYHAALLLSCDVKE